MQFSLIPFISSFALTVIFLPLFIGFMRMKHEGQVIRDEGPKWHEKKSGTPTMGGVVFMLAGVISTLCFYYFRFTDNLLFLSITFPAGIDCFVTFPFPLIEIGISVVVMKLVTSSLVHPIIFGQVT